MSPRLLDLFSGAGGAAMGYHRAGFDEIVGVDVNPQPNYPFTFIQGDALHPPVRLEDFNLIHASPPCQHYANVTLWRGSADDHPALIEDTRLLLQGSGRPWIIENVRTTALRDPLVLCGSMFGLKVRRHRYFESNCLPFQLHQACLHGGLLPFMHKGERAYADAMGCDWMSSLEAREAIPPAYCEYLGRQFLDQLVTR